GAGGAPYRAADQLIDDLLALIEYLESDHDGLFIAHVEALLWRVVVFGFHFATLDVRQDSRVYGRATAQIRGGAAGATQGGEANTAEARTATSPEGGAMAPADAEFQQWVTTLHADEIPSRNDALDALGEDPVLRDTVESLEVVREIQSAVGSRGVHRAIISNTRSATNVLQVMYLARVAGFPRGGIGLDIVPLFETVDDLSAAPEIMRRLYTTPLYRDHLAQRQDTQQIMLGFSDGTKDGGYITANWLIYRAREELTAVAAGYGVRVVFFEGRGGPPARGGGKTHQFYRSMSPQSDREQIHLTIQGQTISSNYGTVDAARYNLEQLVTAALENILFRDTDTGPDAAQRELLEAISSTSLERYHALKNRVDFLPYLETVTPLAFYGAANNASRPTSRGGGGSLRLEDLRAIPFVGAWSQMKQNVPGYFGFGTALRRLIDAGHGEELRHLYREELFFRTLVENSMQSLRKVNFDVTRHLDGDAQFGDLWRELRDEAKRTAAALLEVSGTAALLENDPVTARSIALREAIVLPVLVIQQHALMQLRRDTLDDSVREAYRGLVVKSMAAIINAGRNSV
ncbi:MAG: phosphoenolpyruvate carboxylase, partial [Spirochaeta sp.]|nr:phosphoenolpyruvate carboxylase [Spirochaeta sp.]